MPCWLTRQNALSCQVELDHSTVFRHETMTEPRKTSAAAQLLCMAKPLYYIKRPPCSILWGAAESTQMNKRHLNFYLAHTHTSRLFRLRLSLTCAVGKSPSQPPPRRAHRERDRQHFPFTAVPDVRGGTSSSRLARRKICTATCASCAPFLPPFSNQE